MLATFLIWYRKSFKPGFNGFLFKLFYGSEKIKLGKGIKCDTFPDLHLTEGGKLIIGNNVLIRRNVEIRIHKKAVIHIEDNVRLDRGIRLLATNGSELIIGNGTRIGMYSIFNGGDSIRLGNNVLIAGFVYLQTSMHQYKKGININEQGYHHAPIIIEKDVWVGAHSTILPGVKLEEGAVVGSNAVVNKNVEKNTVVGGVPAKVIRERE